LLQFVRYFLVKLVASPFASWFICFLWVFLVFELLSYWVIGFLSCWCLGCLSVWVI
jgi:hypothetical protein